MRKILISLLVALFAIQVSANSEWHLLTDTDKKIAMVEVDYLLASDNADEFSVVCKNGEQIGGVTRVTFEYSASVERLDNVSELLTLFPNPVVSMLNLSGCKDGMQINILSLDGKVLISGIASEGKASINVDGLAPGYYLLQTENTTIKFIKK